MKKILYVLSITLSIHTFSQSNWKLIYHNDENGETLSGDIELLKKAIEAGEVVRIGFGSGRIKHYTEASFFTIMKDSIVFAQGKPIIGQTPNFETGEIRFKENLEWSFIAGTNGKMTTMMRNVVTGEILGHRVRVRKNDFKWFIEQD